MQYDKVGHSWSLYNTFRSSAKLSSTIGEITNQSKVVLNLTALKLQHNDGITGTRKERNTVFRKKERRKLLTSTN